MTELHVSVAQGGGVGMMGTLYSLLPLSAGLVGAVVVSWMTRVQHL